jgi:carboxyl-terminal processing protease
MTSRTRLSVLLVSTPLVTFAIVGGFLGKASAREDASYQHLRVFEDVVSLTLNNYVEEVEVDRVMDGAMRGLAEGLDADSAWLTKAQAELVERRAPLPEGDTGIELTRAYYLRVVAVRDGSSAARAGLQTGDFLRSIDGRPTRDLSAFEGTRLLRGPVGSKVTLTVLRGNAAEPHEVELQREKLAGPLVTGRLLSATLGLVRVAAFEPGADEALARQADELQRAGADRLIVDLRGTAQGTYEVAQAAARLFLRSATLVKQEARGEEVTPLLSGPTDGRFALPVTVLVTTGTAGPAEIFAAALSGNGRADLVGERTLGRAARQRLVKLPDGSGLWLTWARFLDPGGKAIHGSGLEPAIVVEEPDVEFGAEPPATDPILDRAIEHATLKKAA